MLFDAGDFIEPVATSVTSGNRYIAGGKILLQSYCGFAIGFGLSVVSEHHLCGGCSRGFHVQRLFSLAEQSIIDHACKPEINQ